MYARIPHLYKILKPRWAHKPGFGMSESYTLKKQKIWEQSTTPEDSRLLDRLGIKKKEKVLAIAGYYADWASAIARAGAKVDYSDISQSMVSYCKKKYGKLFNKYICSNYELIPEFLNEYDWTFTYESCGGGSGLPIAYLRSLLNKKGGILVLFLDYETHERMGSKQKNYPRIVNTLGEIYNIKSSVKKITLKAHRKGRETKRLHYLKYTIRTNAFARKKAELDLKILEEIQNKVSFRNKTNLDSIKRLSKLSKIIKKDFVKEVKII
jgi:hypothetical protein